jgi:hypothetical protein
LPEDPAVRWALAVAAFAALAGTVTLGIRALSADYLIRVTALMHGGSAAGAKPRRSRTAAAVGRRLGGQAARAAYDYVSRLALRDYQFRRNAAPMAAALLVGLVPAVWKGWRTDPFSGAFTTMHLLPHILGLFLFFACNMLQFGNDFKAAWLFLLAPGRAFEPFARGVHAVLWINGVLVPHAVALPALAWAWGIGHAALFVAYSAALASLYLSLTLRLIEAVPFTKQTNAEQGATLMPMIMAAGAAGAVVVGLQYLLLFKSPAAVALGTAVIGTAAYFLTRSAIGTLETSMRYSLALLSSEAGTLYKEVV